MTGVRKRVLVTGGAGFLGSHLCERLMAETDSLVICLDNFFTGSRHNVSHLLDGERFEVIRHDVCDPIRVDVDEIYHLACPASPVHYQRNPVQTIQTCVVGTLRMLDLARHARAKLLLASTSEVYGDPLVHPQDESYWGNVSPIGPRACYDEGKRCAEALAVSFALQYSVPIRIARIFNTYGPRMLENDGRVISNFIVQSLCRQALTVYGDGGQTRSFCYVDDLINGLVRLMESDVSGPVNLGNPGEYTIGELAEKIRALTGSTLPIEYCELPQHDPKRRRPDIARAMELLGWHPTVQLDEGLGRTIEYFRRISEGSGSSADLGEVEA